MKKLLIIFSLFFLYFNCVFQGDINIKNEKEAAKDDNAKEYPYFAQEFLDLFDHSKLHIFEVQISQSEWDGIIQDMLDKGAPYYRSGKLGKANLIYKGTTTEPTSDIVIEEIGIRTRGNTTRIFPEYPIGSGNYHRAHFLIKFNETFNLQEGTLEYNARKDRRFRKLRGLNFKWSMANSTDDRSKDPSMIRELYSYDFLNRCGVYAPKTGSAKLYIKIGDKPVKYFGIYTIIEPVDKSFLKKRFGPDGNDGNLYKCLWQKDGPATLQASINGKIGVKNFDTQYFPSYQRDTNETNTDYSDIINFSNNITNLTGTNFKTYIDANFEVDRFIRWIAANVLLGMPDDYWSMGNNYFLYFNNKTKKVEFIPYDYDHGLGGGWYGGVGVGYDAIMNTNIYQWFYTAGGNRSNRPLIDKILSIPEYKARYENYLKEWTDPSTGIFNYNDYLSKFNSLYNLYKDHIDNDINEGEVMSNEPYVEAYFTGKISSVRNQLGLTSDSLSITAPVNPPKYNNIYYYFINNSVTVSATGSNLSYVTFTLKKRNPENIFTTIQTLNDNSSPFEATFDLSDFAIYRITATDSGYSKDIDFFRYDNSINSPEISGNNVTFRWKKSDLTGSENVYITGSFNGWAIDSNYKMNWNLSGGYFEKTVTITDTGILEYKFYYNDSSDKWFYDPHNYKNQGSNYLNSILEK